MDFPNVQGAPHAVGRVVALQGRSVYSSKEALSLAGWSNQMGGRDSCGIGGKFFPDNTTVWW